MARVTSALARGASRAHHAEDTVIEVRGVKIGGPHFTVIAGPCAVESRDQITSCARIVRERGGRVLRGGCFKPRTSPYSFQGLGFEGLDLLVEAGRAFGLPVITEVLSPADVQAVAAKADILQIGARNMQNFALLKEVGRVPCPVMLKRGLMASLDELLQAAEHILSQGNQQVILCERGIRIGGDEPPVLIAGPCSVESREQIFEAARGVREAGGVMLRGGCFKPRTLPYDFQGLGFEGLAIMHEAGRANGLPIVTEVLHPADVEAVAREADVLQIGARNMQNFELLKEVGKTQTAVLLKRGMMASIDEWLAAAEYVLAGGNGQVILCERGIRTFEVATRNTLDLSAIPVLRRLTHLPVLVDPSHAAGERTLVPPMALAARAVGAHGVMIEIHPEPAKALSDGPQALTFDGFTQLMPALCAERP